MLKTSSRARSKSGPRKATPSGPVAAVLWGLLGCSTWGGLLLSGACGPTPEPQEAQEPQETVGAPIAVPNPAPDDPGAGGAAPLDPGDPGDPGGVSGDLPGPGPAPADRFHPEGAPDPERTPPAPGGRVAIHLETPVGSFNSLIDNSGVSRRLQLDLHERLVQRDWESWEFEGRLARNVVVEDTVVLKNGERLVGTVTRSPGDHLDLARPSALERSAALDWDHPLPAPRRIAMDEVDRVLPGTVFTFLLRDDVRWHDGHPFDAGDVMFTFRCTKNPQVPCDQMRFAFDKIESAERLGEHAVRFHFERPYFQALAVFEGMTIQPAHLLDLSDPDCPEHDPGATPEAQGRHLVEHPVNRNWVGLGPYRVTDVTDTHIDAERCADYFDPARGGHFDAVRWRIIRDDHAAFLALVNGELDFTARISSADYFGDRAASEGFRERFYTGLFHTPVMSYTVWNAAREPFGDERVRRALSMGFDWDAFIAGYYRGHASRVTSEVYPGSPYYDRSVAPIPHDPAGARALLAEAGWYDRDGDGLADRDGQPLRIELLVPGGSATGLAYGQKLAEDLGAIGVEVALVNRDAVVFFEQLAERDFDAVHLAWYMPVESDPEQLWHSRWVGPHTGNHGGFADAEADRLIDALQVEPDDAERVALFHRLHALVHGRQAYSYGVHVPRKFAASRRLRNVQTFAIEPGYSLRRWYFEDGE